MATLFAHPAHPATLVDSCVFVVVGMSLRASASNSPKVQSPVDVLNRGNSFEMVWPYTVADAAQVIPYQSFWWCANKEVMHTDSRSANSESAIASVVQVPKPQGTAIGTARIDHRPEALFGGETLPASDVFGDQGIAVALPPPVVHIAPAVAVNVLGAERDVTLSEHRELILSGVTGTEGATSRPLYFTTIVPVKSPNAPGRLVAEP